MSRARLPAIALAAAAVAGSATPPAAARSVRSGSVTRMKRTSVLDVTQVLWDPAPTGDGEGAVRMTTYSQPPHVGDRFVLVDTRGPYAAIEIRETLLVSNYGGPPSYEVIGRYTESPAREREGVGAALGPTQRSLGRARVLPYGPLEGGPAGVAYPMLMVDGDGDGRADFTVGSIQCGDDISARWPDWGLGCFDSWIREGSGWKLVERSVQAYEGD